MDTDETTPLRVSEPDRSYVYMSARNRVYRSKVRQFQCCICAGLLGSFVLAMIITVSYMVNHDADDVLPPVANATELPPLQQLKRLLQSTGMIKDAEDMTIPVTGYNSIELEVAFAKANDDIHKTIADEVSHPSVPLKPNHPSSLHQKVMYSSPNALRASKSGQIILAATKNIYKDKWQKGNWKGRGPRLAPSKWVPKEWCPTSEEASAKCDSSSPYRTIDGTCNNLAHPDFGVAMKPFRRLMAPDYGDGISSPRKAKDGGELPSAREVSINVHRPVYQNDPKFTVVLAVWGQFVDHDFTATALSHRSDGQAITCCNTVWQHPECFPVPLAAGDPFYHQYNLTCMDFVRSAPAPTCSLGPREQLNQVTPFIDGSVVYGADDELVSELRTFTNGLLVSSRSVDGRELLPVNRKPQDGCNQAEEAAKGRYCFKSGDARANENLHLTTLHLIFARQHNKLATALKQRNPTWTDEQLFQESRKIVAAQLQHVHYNEFLPIILGRDLANDLELPPQSSGYYHGYNSSVNPQIANEFAANAFRFGHTLLQGLLKMIAGDKSSEDYVHLHKMLFNPFGLYETGYIEKTVRGATRTELSKPGNAVSQELQGNLFKPKTGPCGLDLVSLNIQRGRDHGLPGYPEWREYCGGNRPRSFEDLEEIMDTESVERMRSMYATVDDIDPYTGLVSETPVTSSGILGPTATCVIAEQFTRLKKGDRFWYETPEAPQAFTPRQLDEIRKTTLSSLLCDNTDTLDEVQLYSMESISEENKVIPCADMPRPDLDAWTVRPFVRLQATGIKPRPGPTAEELDSSLRDPTNPIIRKRKRSELVVGATAVSGLVTGGFENGVSETIWNGTLPVTIPSNFINHVLPSDGEPLTPLDPALIDHRAGFLWHGTVYLVGNERLELDADFSVPIFITGNGFTQQWWNGHAKIQLNVNWNSSAVEGQSVGDYFTPIALRSQTNDPAEGVGAVPILSSSEVVSMRFPILFKGSFNWDHSLFSWNGNVTLIYPHKPRPTLQMSYDGSSPYVRPVSRLAVGATATSGSISGAYDGGSAQTLWDGSFPVSIPSPFLDHKLPEGTTLPPPDPAAPFEHRGGAFWNGKISIDASDELVLTGSFSLPVFLHADMGVTAQKWWSGTFGITLAVNWNSTAVHGLPEGKYFSPLAFRQAKIYGPSHPYSYLTSVNPEDLDATAPAPLPRFPIILHGDYDTNHTHFLWNGNVTLIFPKESTLSLPAAPLTMLLASKPTNSAEKPASTPSTLMKPVIFGGKVVSTSYNFDDLQTWDGSSPIIFPLPVKGVGPAAKDMFHGGDSVFTGSIDATSPTQISLSGNFSVPIANTSNAGALIWQTGTIDAVLDVTWNSSLPMALSSINETFYCKIFLKSSPAVPKLKSPSPEMNNLMVASETGPSVMPKCILILSGSSPDNTTFSWTGSYVAIITAPPAPSSAPSRAKRHTHRKPTDKAQLQLSHGLGVQPTAAANLIPKAGHKMVLGGHVTDGKVTASSGGSPKRVLFHGSYPVSIPLPAFDRYLSRTIGEYSHPDTGPIFHGNGPLWAGSITHRDGTQIIELYGNFRCPLYVHGNTFEQVWWTGHAELRVKVAWSNIGLENAPTASLPDADFYSPIRFRFDEDPGADPYAQAQKVDSDMMDTTPMLPPDEPFYPKGRMPKFPIILHGAMNEDKSAFLWFGNITMVFPYIA